MHSGYTFRENNA